MNESYSYKIDQQGRILLPANWRRKQGIRPNSELIVTIENDRLTLQTRDSRLRQAQSLVRGYLSGDRSQVEELLRERREEARSERSA